MADLPSTITKTEEVRYDEYSGPLADLIAAGLVRHDQLPPEGKKAISWSSGVQQSRNVRRDEHYLRVMLLPRGRATLWVGVSAEVSAPRAKASREAWAAEWQAREDARKREAEAKERAEKAKRAGRNLKSSLRMDSERAYREHVAERLRDSVCCNAEMFDSAARWHGYRLSREGCEAIMIAADALVEAMMQADVVFDAELHERIIAGYRAEIRAADSKFYDQLDKLAAPNPSILAGEQA